MEDEHDLLYTKYNSSEQLWKRLIANISLVTDNVNKAKQMLKKQQEKTSAFL